MASSDFSSFGSRSNKPNKEIQKSNKQLTIPEDKGRGLDCSLYKHHGIAGTPLAHVLSININPVTEGCKLYGKIWAQDHNGTVDYLFNLKRDKPMLVSSSSDNSLLLCQTNRAIGASAFFEVHFDLKDGDSEFLKESFSWYAKNDDENYDKLLDKTFIGKHGSATMSYIVHSLAIEGHFLATFNKSETANSSIHAKGTMFARFKNMRHVLDDPSYGVMEYTRVKIFEESALEMNDKEEFLPDRSVVAIPLYYPLVIEVDFRSEGQGQGQGSELFWNREVEFSSEEIMRHIAKEIQGPNGCMSLTVYGINYATRSFIQLEDRKDSWRKSGWIVNRWTCPDDDSSDDDGM